MRYTGQNINICGTAVKQINRTAARKAYDRGEMIYINPCNMRLNGVWWTPMSLDNYEGLSFDVMINKHAYYSLSAEMGLYFNFFKKI